MEFGIESVNTIIAICMSVVGILLIFSIHQMRVLKKWRMIYRLNTWKLYRDISTMHSDLLNLQQKLETNQKVDFELGKLTGHVQDLLNNQIRQIDINEHITYKKIEKWLKTGKIHDLNHKTLFKKIVDK